MRERQSENQKIILYIWKIYDYSSILVFWFSSFYYSKKNGEKKAKETVCFQNVFAYWKIWCSFTTWHKLSTNVKNRKRTIFSYFLPFFCFSQFAWIVLSSISLSVDTRLIFMVPYSIEPYCDIFAPIHISD